MGVNIEEFDQNMIKQGKRFQHLWESVENEVKESSEILAYSSTRRHLVAQLMTSLDAAKCAFEEFESDTIKLTSNAAHANELKRIRGLIGLMREDNITVLVQLMINLKNKYEIEVEAELALPSPEFESEYDKVMYDIRSKSMDSSIFSEAPNKFFSGRKSKEEEVVK